MRTHKMRTSALLRFTRAVSSQIEGADHGGSRRSRVRRPTAVKVYLLPQRAALPSLQTLAARSRCRIVSLLVCLVAGHDVTSRHAHIRLSASRVHRDDLRPLKRTLELMPLGIACPVFPTKFHDASACADSDRGHQQKQLR